MPKIRGVHPDFWTDENVVELSAHARLLWIGLWNHACDNGHLQDKSKQIKMRVLPYDDVNCAELLREIEGQKLIEREGGWITIPNLSHHQKPHKRWWKTCDKPDCDLPEGASHAPNNRGATVAPPKRNGGTTADVDVDVDVELKVTKKGNDDKSSESFEEFWTRYPRKIARGTARKAWTGAVKKTDIDTIVNAARSFAVRSAGSDPKFIPHPATWLNGERWADETETQKAEGDSTWFQPFNPGEPPRDVADDPEKYAAWLEARKQAWREEGGQ